MCDSDGVLVAVKHLMIIEVIVVVVVVVVVVLVVRVLSYYPIVIQPHSTNKKICHLTIIHSSKQHLTIHSCIYLPIDQSTH